MHQQRQRNCILLPCNCILSSQDLCRARIVAVSKVQEGRIGRGDHSGLCRCRWVQWDEWGLKERVVVAMIFYLCHCRSIIRFGCRCDFRAQFWLFETGASRLANLLLYIPTKTKNSRILYWQLVVVLPLVANGQCCTDETSRVKPLRSTSPVLLSSALSSTGDGMTSIAIRSLNTLTAGAMMTDQTYRWLLSDRRFRFVAFRFSKVRVFACIRHWHDTLVWVYFPWEYAETSFLHSAKARLWWHDQQSDRRLILRT
jgi:hypothetical protein